MKRVLSIYALLSLVPFAFSCWQVDMSKINSYLVEHKVAYDYDGRHYEEAINLQTTFSSTHWPDYAYRPETYVNISRDHFMKSYVNVVLRSQGESLSIMSGRGGYEIAKVNIGKKLDDYVIDGIEIDGLWVIDVVLKPNSEYGIHVICFPTNTDKTSFSIWPYDSSVSAQTNGM